MTKAVTLLSVRHLSPIVMLHEYYISSTISSRDRHLRAGMRANQGLGRVPPWQLASAKLLPHLGVLAPIVYGAVHNLFVGNLLPPAAIYALEFDDETNDFKLLKNNTADASHAWITFDHAKKNIYGASLNETRIASYSVLNATTLELTRNISATGACFNTTSPFVIAMPTPPYHVFSGSWPAPNACGMSLSTSETGALTGVLDAWSYINASGIHGLALSPPLNRNPNQNTTTPHQLLYSADLNGDLIWTHAIDLRTGSATEVSRFPMPGAAGAHPRHLAAHPNGARLYAVMEGDNSVAEYVLDDAGAGGGAVAAEVVRHSLLPIDADTERYWSAEVMLSASGRYLWATARAREEGDAGFVSVFLVGADGGIAKRMFRVPTTTTGGKANAGYVLMWRMEGARERADGLVEYETARAVARVDLKDGGCCANAIWYS
ncbi:Lactonase, 7-bladed beta-propeller-domain-containing protein [Chaetomium sp. MPI-CAGE-AT-0009]|nr:Lactonase, 7-bladed beta-propeller-domain-containing protein [Chaetomium sp. MPI-CAGE-AT-0009]